MTQPSKKQVGDRGEAIVADWLRAQGWQIVARQWHSRWGELDIVAHHPASTMLAFVEVKTRRSHSLDQEGRLAITARKQQKLWRTAEQFLSQHPDYQDCACRFDVALVRTGSPPTLADYIADAFQGG